MAYDYWVIERRSLDYKAMRAKGLNPRNISTIAAEDLIWFDWKPAVTIHGNSVVVHGTDGFVAQSDEPPSKIFRQYVAHMNGMYASTPENYRSTWEARIVNRQDTQVASTWLIPSDMPARRVKRVGKITIRLLRDHKIINDDETVAATLPEGSISQAVDFGSFYVIGVDENTFTQINSHHAEIVK